MIRLALRASLACLVVLAGCSQNREPAYQGWIEANLVFVSPDEAGRIETQPVREGDRVEARTLLFTLDDDLQRADVAEREAAVENAKAAYDRAVKLLKTAAGTQRSSFIGTVRRHGKCTSRLPAAIPAAMRRAAASGLRRNGMGKRLRSVSGVFTKPGETVTTLMPRPRRSPRRLSRKWVNAALLAQ